jgi:hypothetical protein
LSTVYYAQISVGLQKQNQDLQNSIYNYKPFIFSNYSSSATFKTIYYTPSLETRATLFGNVPIELKVIASYDGLLTVVLKSFNFTYLNDSNNPTSVNLDMDNLKSVIIADVGVSTVHQYFIAKDFTNTISDSIPTQLTVYLKPNLLGIFPNSVSNFGFVLGDVVFESSLVNVRTNQTAITQDFNVKVWANISIPSS